ncbi:MAG: addiction module protein [Phycisphaerales bacterium]|nr:MAG: addiction module protein [Phycisphaerales bacterium]
MLTPAIPNVATEANVKIQDPESSERLRLVENIWDSIVAEQEGVPIPPAQRDELDRRLERYRIDRDRGTPAVTAIERIRERLTGRSERPGFEPGVPV